MLHGLGRAGRTFSSFATMLPERFRIRAIDFRGHGQSARAFGAYRVIDYVNDAVAAVKAIGAPVVLYGHSLGSLVSAAVAAQLPSMVTTVILEDPPSAGFWATLENTNYLPTFAAMQKWAGRRDLSVSELARGFGQEILKSWPDGRVMRISDVRDAVSLRFTASCLRDLDPAVMVPVLQGHWPESFQFEEIFRSVRCPALLMRGDVAKGGMLPEADADHFISLMTDGIRIDFPTAGHLLHWQVRSETAGQVSAFLETVS
jgi:pimeloyl-ACP methyl ester carboxylesterase